ncbi:uncharacterized protein I303_106167 [Kwoniella dejecticola CBS 10117]|uniref:AA1-like domain-containing protein n=1 Tax=Kwoniella dejecticola CBS 10117 TaxID=1296121 RepID=A0A1A6A1H8_9TREE|nr:uncharacterized protein I303_06185 [Kwoniella dejecticola CBS 10117]OBR83900.1 hypothetical protein I303_06185 [Kwoniella dejecticola CBS 10117]
MFPKPLFLSLILLASSSTVLADFGINIKPAQDLTVEAKDHSWKIQNNDKPHLVTFTADQKVESFEITHEVGSIPGYFMCDLTATSTPTATSTIDLGPIKELSSGERYYDKEDTSAGWKLHCEKEGAFADDSMSPVSDDI